MHLGGLSRELSYEAGDGRLGEPERAPPPCPPWAPAKEEPRGRRDTAAPEAEGPSSREAPAGGAPLRCSHFFSRASASGVPATSNKKSLRGSCRKWRGGGSEGRSHDDFSRKRIVDVFDHSSRLFCCNPTNTCPKNLKHSSYYNVYIFQARKSN